MTTNTDNMKVLIIGSNSSTGGIQRYIDQQVEHLSDKITTGVYDTEIRSGNGPIWLMVVALQMVFDALRFPLRKRPDIVHVHTAHWYSFYRASFYVLFASIVWRIPVVLHIHGSSFDKFLQADSRFAQAVQNLVFLHCDTIITLSEYWREVVETSTEASSVRVVPNAVDPTKYNCTPDSKLPTIVYISHLSERKGADDFACAINQLMEEEDNVITHVAGSGPYQDRIEALAAEYEEVHCHGYVSEEKKRELLEEGTIFVLPSYAEGLPIAILEAMAAGNAIISTSVGAIPEVISNDRGRVIEPGEPDNLSTTLRTLCQSESIVHDMGEANCNAIKDTYNWNDVSQELLSIYSHIN